MKSLIKWAKGVVEKYNKKKQEEKYLQKYGFIVYCPCCRQPLNDSPFVYLDESNGQYSCSTCGTESVWNFDMYS